MIQRFVLCTFLVLLPALETVCCAQPKAGEQQLPKEITGESYWYNYAMQRVLKSSVQDGYIVGTIQARHGLSNFRVRRDVAEKPDVKSRGLKMAFEELVSWLKTTSREFALARLRAM